MTSTMRRMGWTLLASGMAGAVLPGGVVGQSADLASQVEAAEIAFAKTMADRDFDAFLSFLSADAIFFVGDEPLRGRDAVGTAWASFFEGPAPPFSWSPAVVEVLESGDLALSSGPVLAPDGQEVGRFTTIWRRESDGRWRVVFDKGS